MRTVVVNKFWYPKGGSERHVFLLKELLEARGHEVIPFAMDDERNLPTPWSSHFVSHVDFWDAGDTVPNQTKMLERLSRVLWSREAADRFGRLLDEVRPDMVHLHNFTHQISPSIIPEATRRGIPVVWTLHDYKLLCPNYRMYTQGSVCERCKGGRYRNAVRYQCMGSTSASVGVALEMYLHHAIFDVYGRHLDAVIAPSQFLADKVLEWGWKGRIETLPNFVMTNDQFPMTKGEHGPVLFVGRLTEEKGIEDFVEAARRLPEIPFVVVGEGPAGGRTKMTNDQGPMTKMTNVTWMGSRSSEETQAEIARAAMVVVPSRWYENAPYVVLEAMAAGVPVIATRMGGLPELVRHEETGLLVPPRDPAALAQSIAMLYHRPALQRTYGERACAVAREQYGPEPHYQGLLSIYASQPNT